jgi:hypothetical protein
VKRNNLLFYTRNYLCSNHFLVQIQCIHAVVVMPMAAMKVVARTGAPVAPVATIVAIPPMVPVLTLMAALLESIVVLGWMAPVHKW